MERYQVETNQGQKVVIAETRQEAIAKATALGLTVTRARREYTASDADVVANYTEPCRGCRTPVNPVTAHRVHCGTVIDVYCDTCHATRKHYAISSRDGVQS